MTDDGGRAYPGWQDPNGPQDPYGPYQRQDPYGPPPYQYPYGYGPPTWPPAQPTASNGAAVAALVVCIVEVIALGGIFAIPGIICSAIAMGKVQTDPSAARKLTMWAWISAAIAPVIAILLFIFILFPAMQES
jgi:hypothetical protein